VASRLEAMRDTTDGFRIAEVDLQLRGPGEFLGTRQSGLPDFRVVNLLRDSRLLEEARRSAERWMERDPGFERPESNAMKIVLGQRWAKRLGLAEIG
jgi:ATP-dependent DNA helicase RecG